MGGIPTDPDCAGVTPADGESCDEQGMLCQSGSSYCICFGQGGDPTWTCIDGGGGSGFGGFGNGGRAMGGFGNGGRAQAGNGGATDGGRAMGGFGGRGQ
jgi:hypothetical protein